MGIARTIAVSIIGVYFALVAFVAALCLGVAVEHSRNARQLVRRRHHNRIGIARADQLHAHHKRAARQLYRAAAYLVAGCVVLGGIAVAVWLV